MTATGQLWYGGGVSLDTMIPFIQNMKMYLWKNTTLVKYNSGMVGEFNLIPFIQKCISTFIFYYVFKYI